RPSPRAIVPEPSLATRAAAAALAAFVTGFLRASMGGGIGLALTPVLSLALPAQSALGLTGFMLNLADPFVFRYYWRQWDGRQLRLILPTALVGIVLGVWMISGMPDHRLRKVMAAVALVLAVLQLVFMRTKIHVGHHWGVGSSGLGADRHRLGRGQLGRHHHRAVSGRARALECRGGGHGRGGAGCRELPQGGVLLDHRLPYVADGGAFRPC